MEEEKKLIVRLVRKYNSIIQNCGVFGVIIYSTVNVHVKKVLYDEDYSDAIDSLIGDKWPIFSACIDFTEYHETKSVSNGKQYLIKEWIDSKESIELMDVFQISSLRRLPLMIVFTMDENEQIRRRIFQISNDAPSSVFNDLKYFLSEVHDALQEVDYGANGWDKAKLKLDHAHRWKPLKNEKDYILNWLLEVGRGNFFPTIKIEGDRKVEINISGVVGMLNTGEISNVEKISVNVSTLTKEGDEKIAEALKYLTEAVANSQEISSRQRMEVLEQLEELSNQSVLPPEKRLKLGVIKATIQSLAGVIGATGGLVEVWSKWGPVIKGFFGL